MKSDIFIRPTRELFLQTLSFIVKERNRMEEEEKSITNVSLIMKYSKTEITSNEHFRLIWKKISILQKRMKDVRFV